jgi:hypothetical protein
VLGDVCGDSRLEVCFYADSTERVYVVDADGVVLWHYDIGEVADIEGSPIIADLTGDGKGEVICAYQQGFVVFDSAGIVQSGFPDVGHDAKLPVVIESDDDVMMVAGSQDWRLYGYRSDGTQAPGFPIQCGSRIESSPAVYDIDDDGQLELMVGGFDFLFYVFDLVSSSFQWPRFRYDPYNSGTYCSGYYPGVLEHRGDVLYTLHISPNPFRRMARIKYQIQAGLRENDMSLKIYDITGRLVKDCSPLLSVIGDRSSVIWTGDDDRGRSVSAGVYFVRLETPERVMTTKIVKIK